LEKKKKILDIGSGAGFPGIVCAICSNSNFILVEANKKKCIFLSKVKKEIDIKNVSIHNDRVENLQIIDNIDFITARAVASLDKLFKYTFRFCKKGTQCIFLKGKKVFNEVEEARKKYEFEVKFVKSLTNEEGRILLIKNLKKR